MVFGALLSLFTSVEAKAGTIEVFDRYGGGVDFTRTSRSLTGQPVLENVEVIVYLKDDYRFKEIEITDDYYGQPRYITNIEPTTRSYPVTVKIPGDNPPTSNAIARIRVETVRFYVGNDGHGSVVSESNLGSGGGYDVTLTATPDPGYEFDRWETNSGITINPTDNPAAFSMIAGPVSVRAKFKSTGNASSPSSGTTTTMTPTSHTKPKDDDDDDDHHHEDEPAPAPKPVDPNAVIGMSFAGNLTGNVRIGPQVQGLIARQAFLMNTPKGWKEAFTFNMTVNDKADYSLKKGTLSFRIPTQYQKAGRKYAILGLDKNGKVKVFNDIDLKPDTITVNLDIEGYAFDLIYCD